MRIIELCRKYGLSRKTVHFYIKSGLLKPAKLDNNYFDFKESDIRRLELIIKLRKLGFIQRSINAVRLSYKLVMRADFGNLAIVYNHNFVGIMHG